MTGEACKKIDLDNFKIPLRVLIELYGKQENGYARTRMYLYLFHIRFQKTGTPERSVLYD